MDVRVIFTTFAAVLVAELADKTQLVGLGISAKTAKPLSVFFGSVFAYAIITAATVIVGSLIGKHIRPEYVRNCAGFGFIIVGVLFLYNKI